MTMPTYISLLRLTQQGMQNIKESPNRVAASRKAFENAGGRLRDIYVVTGQYDFVAIMEAPDDEAAARMALSLGALGNVRSETMRAFSEEEYRRIVGALP
jgi:uncharacterized protein with GYD domain